MQRCSRRARCSRLQPPTHAAAGTLYVSQTCAPDGVAVNFGWDGQDATLIQVWIDISLTDNGFVPGTFISAGPLPGWASSYEWRGIRPSMTHYVRINQQRSNGTWDASGTFIVSTIACGGGAAPIAGVGRPSIQNRNLHVLARHGNGDERQPDGPQGRPHQRPARRHHPLCRYGHRRLQLADLARPQRRRGLRPLVRDHVRPGAVAELPNTISLTLNWNGNPALADISVFIVAPAVQTCTSYYYPGLPYNPYVPCGYPGTY